MKIYVSGPMTGIPELNFPAFNRVTVLLRSQGHEVINPVEINPDPNADWYDCIVADIRAMQGCDAICLLKGWHNSWGAKIEYCVAKRHNMKRMLESDLYNNNDDQ